MMSAIDRTWAGVVGSMSHPAGGPPSPLTLRARDRQTEHARPDRTAAYNAITRKSLIFNDIS